MTTAKHEVADDGEPILETTDKRCTELGNAQRLVELYGSQIRYLTPPGSWLVWDGRRWRQDDKARIWRHVRATLRSIYAEAGKAEKSYDREQLSKWAVRSESHSIAANSIRWAQSAPGIPITPDELDTDPWLFNCANGTVDLHTGQLRPHERGDLISKLSPVEYDPDATCPTWDAFLNRIMGGNTELVDYLQLIGGMALVGKVFEHALAILYGTGANGKTTFMEALLHTFGDYGMPAAPDLLVAKQHEQHPTEIADLMGMRLVTSQEPNQGVRLDEGKVKYLTGSDQLKGRFMGGNFFDFEQTHTLFLATNHKPVVRGADEGIWRRLKLIPFAVTIPQEDRDGFLGVKLQAESAGILAWLVRGCLKWQEQGLTEPPAVRTATDDYRTEMDTLGGFIAERCILRRDARVTTAQLYAAYRSWIEGEGSHPLSKKALGTALADRGFQKGHTNRDRYWDGIDLISSSGDACDATSGPSPHENSSLQYRENTSHASPSYSNGSSEDPNPPKPSGVPKPREHPCPSCGNPGYRLTPDGRRECDGPQGCHTTYVVGKGRAESTTSTKETNS